MQNNRGGSVWDEYDIRTPVPYDSAISPSQAAERLRAYDPYNTPSGYSEFPYVDNDAYYRVPKIQCGIRDLPACGE